LIRFDGRVAVVTGAGVGRAGEGGDPTVADAVVAEIREAGGTAIASYENLESEEACIRVVESAVAALGRVDVLVNTRGWSFTRRSKPPRAAGNACVASTSMRPFTLRALPSA
jgi:NAD(P)-dependent dehydrogenase (short-subunit alcohol dehydrogenase family)